MKHGVRFWEKKLNRTPEHRAALLKNLMTSLVTHEKIETTVAKAKYMKRATDLVLSYIFLSLTWIDSRHFLLE
jgi:large subunit ribosomal protein L17